MTQILSSCFQYLLNWVNETAAGILSTRIIANRAINWLDPDEVEKLTLGIEGNVIQEMNLAIGDLADIIRDSPILTKTFDHLGEDGNEFIDNLAKFGESTIFIEAWHKFISSYGMRGPSEIDITQKRWYEDPLPLLRVMAEFLKKEKGLQFL